MQQEDAQGSITITYSASIVFYAYNRKLNPYHVCLKAQNYIERKFNSPANLVINSYHDIGFLPSPSSIYMYIYMAMLTLKE